MQGDCLERMKEIPDGSVDMILTDPPYGTTACKWDSIIPVEPMWEQLKRIIKPNGAIVMTASQPFTTTLIASNIKMFKYCWVWEKSKASNFLQSGYMPLKAHEDVVVFCKKGKPTYNPQITYAKPYRGRTASAGSNTDTVRIVKNPMFRRDSLDGARKPRTVQYFKVDKPHKILRHPTQKPVALMEYLIKTYTNENETVLDFTMGSGTTGVACVNTNRDFIGIELDKNYFRVAKDRIKISATNATAE